MKELPENKLDNLKERLKDNKINEDTRFLGEILIELVKELKRNGRNIN